MKTTIVLLLSAITANFAHAQTGNIRFTAVKNTEQPSQIIIKAKNISASPIEGILGSSNITLSVAFPSTTTGLTISIQSPIAGQEFEPPLKNKFGTDSIYSWNGKGSTSAIAFAVNTPVDIARVSFDGGSATVTSSVKIVCLDASGPSGFDYCYIAPGGKEESGYSTPFYSDVASDPLLNNCGGANDAFSMCTSTLGISDAALPVKFLSFYALKSGTDAKLTWTVESDGNNKYFDVERSVDGRTYTAFTRVNALKNGKSVNTYETADNGILGGNEVYYRIKQVDENGTVTYSLIRNLKLDKSLTISLYPNPGRTTTKLVLDAQFAGKASISIRDVAGKQVQLQNIQLVKGINQHNLNIQTLPAGEYNVTIIGEKLNQTIKLSKIN